jgi:hypothetical protein
MREREEYKKLGLLRCPLQKPNLKKNYVKFIGIDIANTKTR